MFPKEIGMCIMNLLKTLAGKVKLLLMIAINMLKLLKVLFLKTRIHPGRCIYFIEEEAKTADTMPKGYPIQTQRTVHTTTYTDQTTWTRLVPSMAKNGEEAIHRGF
jgi:hypothetical protein